MLAGVTLLKRTWALEGGAITLVEYVYCITAADPATAFIYVITNAVVASWVVLVPAAAVGAVGVPVNAGEANGALLAKSVMRSITALCGNEPITSTARLTAPHVGSPVAFPWSTSVAVPSDGSTAMSSAPLPTTTACSVSGPSVCVTLPAPPDRKS